MVGKDVLEKANDDIRETVLAHRNLEELATLVISVTEFHVSTLRANPWQQTPLCALLINREVAMQKIAKVLPDAQYWELFAAAAFSLNLTFLKTGAKRSAVGCSKRIKETVELLGVAYALKWARKPIGIDWVESFANLVESELAKKSARMSHAGSVFKPKIQAYFRQGFLEENPKRFGFFDSVPKAALACVEKFHVTAIRGKDTSPLPTVRKWIWEEYHRIEAESPKPPDVRS